MSDRPRARSGSGSSPRIENLGDGIVQLSADDRWIAGPGADREKNLTTLFELWSAHEGSGLPISVRIADRAGQTVMVSSRP